MPLPDDFYDDDKNYRIRLCMLTDESDLDLVVAGSKVYQCDSCGRTIWVSERMPLPEVDVPVHGDVNVCRFCMTDIVERSGEDPTWIGPPFGS